MKIKFENIQRASNHLSFTFLYGEHRFETAYWYEEIDFYFLENKYGKDFMENIYFHIMAFEFNKLLSLAPTDIDFGKYNAFLTPSFIELWETIARKVWAQWRYENNLPDYRIPSFQEHHFPARQPLPVTLKKGATDNLVFCGGGKDSLVSLKLLEHRQIPYAVFTYSHSIYGPAEKQHYLTGQLIEQCQPVKVHRQWVYDSFLDAPVTALSVNPSISSITAAETPASIFAALPVVLTQGYTNVMLGHERSANKGNLIWQKTGEEINHQWGKSYQAEVLINQYIRANLITNFSFFSLLQPVYDVVIFNLLRNHLPAVPATHSCNIDKPWCKKCAKCAYVWLNYMAYLPFALVNEMFGGVNLFDLPENEIWFRQMLGMTEHTPFECIGQVEEVRLAFELCKAKGMKGKMLDYYAGQFNFTKKELSAIVEKYTDVYEENIAYPPPLKAPLLAALMEGRNAARIYLYDTLQLSTADQAPPPL